MTSCRFIFIQLSTLTNLPLYVSPPLSSTRSGEPVATFNNESGSCGEKEKDVSGYVVEKLHDGEMIEAMRFANKRTNERTNGRQMMALGARRRGETNVGCSVTSVYSALHQMKRDTNRSPTARKNYHCWKGCCVFVGGLVGEDNVCRPSIIIFTCVWVRCMCVRSEGQLVRRNGPF